MPPVVLRSSGNHNEKERGKKQTEGGAAGASDDAREGPARERALELARLLLERRTPALKQIIAQQTV